MPIAVGIRVRFNQFKDFADLGDEGVIVRNNVRGERYMYYVQLDKGGEPLLTLEKRFDVIEAAPPVFKVGDWVKTNPQEIGRFADRFPLQRYKIEKINADGNLWIEGYPGYYRPSRFLPADPRPFQVGDMVKVVAKVEKGKGGRRCNWDSSGVMELCLNSGEAYPIVYIGGGIVGVKTPVCPLERGYYHFLPECLAHADEQPVAVKPKKEKPAIILPDLREELLKIIKARGERVDECSYGILFDDGNLEEQVNDVCHARIAPLNGKLKPVAVALMLQQAKGMLKRRSVDAKKIPEMYQLFTKYIDYLLNSSPWKDVYLTKDINEAMEKGILLNLDMHKNQIAGAAVATREGTEFNKRLHTFRDVLDMGFNDNVAYLCAMWLIPSVKEGEYVEGNSTGGHQALGSGLDWEGLKHFFVKGYAGLNGRKNYRDERGNFFIGNEAVAGYPKGGKSMHKVFSEEVKPRQVGEGWGAEKFYTIKQLQQLAQFIDKELKGVK